MISLFWDRTFYRPQKKLWKGNVFTLVCHSVHWRCTPPWADTPQADTPWAGRHPSRQEDTPLGRQTPTPLARHPIGRHPWQTHPLGRHPSLGRHHSPGRHPQADPLRTATAADSTHPTAVQFCFYKIFGGRVFFCGSTDTPVLDFRWHLLSVSKPEWATLFPLGRGTCDVHSLRFIYDATPVNLLTAWWPVTFPTWISAEVGYWIRLGDLLHRHANSNQRANDENGLLGKFLHLLWSFMFSSL